MTDPQYKGMVIIMAGYSQEIELMLTKNVGLRSRFQMFFGFPDWTGSDCTKLIASMAKKDNFQLTPEVLHLFTTSFDHLEKYPGQFNLNVFFIWCV
jgi:hypothetical protein